MPRISRSAPESAAEETAWELAMSRMHANLNRSMNSPLGVITDGILPAQGNIVINPDNIACIRLVKESAAESRAWGLEMSQMLLVENILKGFDVTMHELVIPKPPFKGNSTIHQIDEGLHLSLCAS